MQIFTLIVVALLDSGEVITERASFDTLRECQFVERLTVARQADRFELFVAACVEEWRA